MSPQETVRQHFVPRTYLKHFSFDPPQKKIYVLGKDVTESSLIRPQRVSEICYQNRLYTLPGNTVPERMELEEFYQSVEAGYNRLQSLLTNPQMVSLTPDDRGEILLTVGTMLHRTTRILVRHNETVNHVLETMYRLAETTGATQFADGYSIAGKSLEEVQAEMREGQQSQLVLTQLDVALRFVQGRQDHYAVMVTSLDENAGEYLTSDNPVWIYALTEPRTAFNPSASIRLPIGPKHLLILEPLPEHYAPENAELLRARVIREHLVGDEAKAQRLTANLLQQENAERWLLGSRAELTRHLHERSVVEQYRAYEAPFSITKFKQWGLM